MATSEAAAAAATGAALTKRRGRGAARVARSKDLVEGCVHPAGEGVAQAHVGSARRGRRGMRQASETLRGSPRHEARGSSSSSSSSSAAATATTTPQVLLLLLLLLLLLCSPQACVGGGGRKQSIQSAPCTSVVQLRSTTRKGGAARGRRGCARREARRMDRLVGRRARTKR
jgi:hypothetical protein